MAIDLFDGLSDYGGYVASLQNLYGVVGFPGNGTNPASLNVTGTGPFGTGALGFSGNTYGCFFATPVMSELATKGGHIRFKANSGDSTATTGSAGIVFCDSANNFLACAVAYIGTNGIATVYAYDVTGTSMGSQTVSGVQNAWYLLEAECTVGTSGSVEIWFNGASVGTFSGNTKGSYGSTVGYVGWGIYAPPSSNNWLFQDFVVWDTTGSSPYNANPSNYAGNAGLKIVTLFPSSDEQAEWTPSSGSSNYALVGVEAYAGDSGYVYTNTVTDQDLYGIGTVSLSTVVMAQTKMVARMDDAGPQQISASIKSGTTIYQGATRTLTANYEVYIDQYSNDPDTGSTWSASKFSTANSLYIGVKEIAN